MIRGIVSSQAGESVANLDVQLVRLGLRKEAVVGRASTDAGGNYEVSIDPSTDGRPHRVHVSRRGKTIARSEPIIARPGEHTVHVVVPGEGAGSEYERVGQTLAGLLDGSEPADLKPEDVAFLAHSSGLDPAAIAAFASAARLARDEKLPPELAYAVARVGGPGAAREVLTGSADMRRYVLSTAVARRLVPASAVPSLEQAVERLGPIPAPAAGDEDLHDVAGDHPQLARLLARLTEEGEFKLPAELVRLDERGWTVLLERTVDGKPVGTPKAFQDAFGAGALTAYSRELMRRAELAFPAQALFDRLERSDLPGAGDLARFVQAHPDFDLVGTPATTYLRDHPEALVGLGEPSQLGDRLAALQRVFRVTPRFEQVQPLLRQGLDSAWRITRSGRAGFVERMAEALGGREAAESVYDQAEDTAALTLATFTNLAHAFSVPGVRGLAPHFLAEEPPDWQDLFGGVSFCACEDCRSVLSPAAYFVDLLAWLGGRPPALDRLFQRRPDLKTLQLSCENTNTALPYVDLVLEILETAISPATEPNHDATTGTTADLVALPENVNAGAYQVLARQVFPWSLPYDLFQDTVRTYLAQFGIQRADLMEAFAADPQEEATALAIAADRLRVTPLGAQVLTGDSGRPDTELWGVDDLAKLRTGSVFLKQSGLSHEELVGLVGTRFVQRLARVTLDQRGDRCDPAELTIAPLGEEVLAGIVRFERLRRSLGWTVAALDGAIHVFDSVSPRQLLLRLAGVERLRSDLRLEVGRLLAFFGNLGTHRPAPGVLSSYEAVFLNPALTKPGSAAADAALQLRSETALVGDGEQISQHAPAVAAALGIDQRDLARLVPDQVPDSLTLAGLSALFRLVTASRSVRLSTQDFLTLSDLAGADPFANPAGFSRFAERVRALRGRRLAAADLDWLLTGRQADLSGTALQPAQVAEIMNDLRSSLRQFWTGDAAQPWADGVDDVVAQTIATALRLSPEVAAPLLSTWLRRPGTVTPAGEALKFDPTAAQDATAIAAQNAELEPTLQALARVAAVVAMVDAAPGELRWLFGSRPGWLDLNQLPTDPGQGGDRLAPLERVLTAFDLRDAVPGILDVVSAALTSGADARAVLLDRTGWEGADVDLVLTALAATDLSDESVLVRLRACLALAARLGVSPAAVQSWTSPDFDLTRAGTPELLGHVAAAAESAVRAVRAHYDDDQWPVLAGQLRNGLRERQRQACLGHLLDVQRLDTPEALYDRILIDPEMSPCQLTSRIKQATAAVQLFVQRCFLGQEPSVTLDPEAADEWEWMSRYRVWEANRKVFLFPEDWVEPELRDDKTPLFEDLENALLQSDVTDEAAADALGSYLQGLDEIARLDVRAVCHDVTKEGADTVHVLARTPNDPHVHYYRRRVSWSLSLPGKGPVPLHLWTPWEKADIDVQGDHLLAAVYNQRLHVFWPLFAVKADSDGAQDQGSHRPADKHLEIQMAWSEYREAAQGDRNGRHRPGTWSAKQVATGGPVIARHRATLDRDHPNQSIPGTPPAPDEFTFRVSSGEELLIDCYLIEGRHTEIPQPLPLSTPARKVGDFRIAACGQGLVAEELDDSVERNVFASLLPDPLATDLGGLPRALPEGDRLVEDTDTGGTDAARFPPGSPDDALYLSVAARPAGGPESTRWQWAGQVLRSTPGTFHLAGARQDTATTGQDVLVYEDDTGHSFFVERTSRAGSGPTNFPLRDGYQFTTFYHPYLCDFVSAFNQGGVEGLLRWSSNGTSVQQLQGPDDWFQTRHQPVDHVTVGPFPQENVDFLPMTPYGVYNWELFFHVPLLVASRLSANQRFEDAQRWFHYLFDPRDQSTRPAPGRYWRVLPFAEHTGLSIDTLQETLARITVLHQQPSGLTGPQLLELAYFMLSLAMWRERPFEPHLLARMRPAAYQKTVVIRYVENLIGWADSQFRQDTMESINDATQLYLLAADILGPRQPEIAPDGKERPLSWNEVADRLDDFSNPLVKLENFVNIPPLPRPGPPGPLGRRPRPRPPVRVHYGFYFCIPRNEKLDQLRKTIGGRLFNIRHCRNIDGIERQLPLFDPPIDPGLLVRAVAAGVDIGDVLRGRALPVLPYRFSVVIARAVELCTEVKALGALMLAALQQRDAEALGMLRSAQELRLLDAVRAVREQQMEEAQDLIDALQKARTIAQTRRDHYLGLEFLNASERLQLQSIAVAMALQLAGQSVDLAASGAFSAPTEIVGGAGISGSPVALTMFGGNEAGTALQAFSRSLAMLAGATTATGALAAAMGGFLRRSEDWSLQASLAQGEMDQIDAQIVAGQVRLAIAQHELENHDLQVTNARSVDDFLKSKFSGRDLFNWMSGQAAAVYYQSYQLALQLAQRAEVAFAFELGLDPTATNFVSPGSWDSLKKGLLAGERLGQDLRRMEVAYLEQNERELEITKHVSLALADPVSLIDLKTKGWCTFAVDEALFDADFPGHYMRRIKSLSVSIPCVTGPYTNVNATLRLGSSWVRFSPDADPDPQNPGVRTVGPARPIALSGGSNDAGLFELNMRDDRYLPFEGQGAVSTWQLEVFKETNRFDLQTISDVVMHLRYTAREGNDSLRDQARQNLGLAPAPSTTPGRQPRPTLEVSPAVRLFSARHEFPEQWYRFLHPEEGAQQEVLALPLDDDRFPYEPGSPDRVITRVQLIVLPADGSSFTSGVSIPAALTPPEGSSIATALSTTLTEADLAGRREAMGEWTLNVAVSEIPRSLRTPGGGVQSLDSAALRDIGILCTYTDS